MRFYYRIDNGQLISSGDDDVTPGPGIGVVVVEDYNIDIHMWDPPTRTVISRPPKVLIDRLADIINDPRFAADFLVVWNALSATRKNQLRNGLIRLLGGQRYRNPGEDLVLL